ncbi:class I SAM-dependent methyltransferase [Gilvimarinus sp. SDUM040013]|uniref:Ribosomal RNA small subunit methyltransferase J n=1 Tax=Gilvimarinus gilvus TaxID=3058038 RepID=A0ABU4RW23_9GAMM|nr:class I SAM-dependent methyltransferase [Gilvimarinus sp. SDUM040013]MDO3386499.1 class I SAM-dependent methyltransferase [Gilvimarinus sp. SDUM040013]MDX6849075.1 class I SAM-dependent methyltransferase [Gilvimarinus sp. SDUM040013]
MSHVVVICNDIHRRPEAARLAQSCKVELLLDVSPSEIERADFALVFAPTGVELAHTGGKAPGPVKCDFASGAVNHRRQFGGGKGQMIAKACGIGARVKPHILDATAGLGRDAFVLATLGCSVHLLERNPMVHALLHDGLARAQLTGDTTLAGIVARMKLEAGDARAFMSGPERFDVVYLDPMFPQRQKSAQVKKEMRAFHTLVGDDPDAGELIQLALNLARLRVVVKRPRKAPCLADMKPNYSLEGKSSRFDVYALQKMPDVLNGDDRAKSDTND